MVTAKSDPTPFVRDVATPLQRSLFRIQTERGPSAHPPVIPPMTNVSDVSEGSRSLEHEQRRLSVFEAGMEWKPTFSLDMSYDSYSATQINQVKNSQPNSITHQGTFYRGYHTLSSSICPKNPWKQFPGNP